MATRIPFSSPMSAKATGVLAVVWPPLVQGLALLVSNALSAPFIVRDLVSIGLLYGVARFAFAATTRGAIAARLALGSITLGALQIAFLLATQPLYRGGGAAGTIALVASMLIPGAFVAFYKAILGWLVGRYVEAPSFETADRAQIAASVWLFVGEIPHATFIVLGMALNLGSTFLRAWGGIPSGLTVALYACLYVLAPAAVVTAAILRIRGRRRWLSSVRAGDIANWRLLEGPAPTAALPHLVRVDAGEVRTLVRVHDPAEPFREGERHEPVALVAASGGGG
jgi:hypothetical protein